MNKKLLIGVAAFFLLMIVLVPVGQYVGGMLFVRLTKLPQEALSITTLMDYWGQYASIKSIRLMLIACFIASVLLPAMPMLIMVLAFPLKKEKKLYGDARFANTAEIYQAGLLNKEEGQYPDVLVGKYKGKFLKFSGQSFILLIAPPRSYKGVAVAIPNLLYYRDSIVSFDPKFEGWKKTSGFRSRHGQECYLFAPGAADFKTHRWNPLSYIRRNPEFRVGDVFDIATILYPVSKGDNAFFDVGAQTLFIGLVLYLLDTENENRDEQVTLSRVFDLTTPDTEKGLGAWIKNTIAERKQHNKPLSKECTNALMSFAQNPEKTQSGILSQTQSPLHIMLDSVTAAATSGDDFDLRDVRKKRMSIYVGINEGSIAKFSRLLNLFYSQLIRENTKELPEHNPALKYQCLLLLDEAVSLGKIKVIQETIGLLPGYNLRFLLIFQNKSQLDVVYGKEGAKSILDAFPLRIAYTPQNFDDAVEYSKMLGKTTVRVATKSRQLTGKSARSESESQQSRDLLNPTEVQEIPITQAIIFLQYCKPIRSDKIIYYTDPVFKDRVEWPVPDVPTLKLKNNSSSLITKTRPVTAGDLDSLDINQITNAQEILNVIMEKITFGITPACAI